MSGIGGILHRTGAPASELDVAPVMERLAHRGPDGRHSLVQGDTAFLYLLNETTPQCRAVRQPLFDAEARVLITCDARLDDRSALARRLGLARDVALTSDAELLLGAYLRWGEDCARHLLGDFAFAIRDFRRDVLFCARDFIGARPFYYAAEPDRFVFASELRGVMTTLEGARVDFMRVADLMLDYESADAVGTFDERVSRLPAGCTLTVDRQAARVRRYWSAADVEQRPWREDEALEALEELLRQSVGDRHRASGSPVVSLSGGLDSAVVMAASTWCGERSAISAVDRAPDCNETRCSRAVRSALGVVGPEVTFADLSAGHEEISRLVAAFDDPFSFSDAMTILMYTRARGLGHRVLLDGVEGDLAHSLPGDLASSLLRRGDFSDGMRLLRAQGTRPLGVARRLVMSGMPSRSVEAVLRRRRRAQVAEELDASPLRLNPSKGRALMERYLDHLAHRDHVHDAPATQHAAWIDMPFITSALERYDRAAALCGVEIRHPLLDRRLVEFALSLPWHLKRGPGRSKCLLRLVAPALPADVRERRDHPHLGWAFTSAWAERSWSGIRGSILQGEPLWAPHLCEGAVMQHFRPDSYTDQTAMPVKIHALARSLECLS